MIRWVSSLLRDASKVSVVSFQKFPAAKNCCCPPFEMFNHPVSARLFKPHQHPTTQRLQSDAGSQQKYQCQPMDPPAKTGDPAESSGRFGFCWKGMNRWQIFGGMDEGKQDAREMVNKISMTVPVYQSLPLKDVM